MVRIHVKRRPANKALYKEIKHTNNKSYIYKNNNNLLIIVDLHIYIYI
jgi:hypothetical protein